MGDQLQIDFSALRSAQTVSSKETSQQEHVSSTHEQVEGGEKITRDVQYCLKCSAEMPPFFWGQNGGQSICRSCGFKHPCCDT